MSITMSEGFIRRDYRGRFDAELVFHPVRIEQTDLMVGAARDCREEATACALEARRQVEQAIQLMPGFLTAMVPIDFPHDAPQVAQWMLAAAQAAQVGPMAAVAGAIAQYVGRQLVHTGGDVIVENGGDVYMLSHKPRKAAIFAGNSPLSMQLAIELPAGEWGVCTSAGKVGPSISFGRADAAVVVAHDTALADACATALGNAVKEAEDIARALEGICAIPGVYGAVAVLGDHIGALGNIKLVSAKGDA